MNSSPSQPCADALPSSANLSSSAYDAWRDTAEELMKPLAALMQQGKADLSLAGRASDHDAQADQLESFARPCLLAAHWLAAEPGQTEEVSRQTGRLVLEHPELGKWDVTEPNLPVVPAESR